MDTLKQLKFILREMSRGTLYLIGAIVLIILLPLFMVGHWIHRLIDRKKAYV